MNKELGVGVFFTLVSIVYIILASTVSTFTPFGNRGLDSRSLPILIGGSALFLSLIHLIGTIIGRDRAKAEKTVSDPANGTICDEDSVACVDTPSEAIDPLDKRRFPSKLVLSILFLCGYFALYQSLGFILSSVLYLFAETVLLTDRKMRKKRMVFIAPFSMGVVVVIYILFTKYLTLLLPRGILG